ncbi:MULTISPECIES: dermonecrotic toxin domain-containing protein [Pseudomonas]|uniref:Dermonecrotic toxin N-terminal domain-containing protein n=1 Tax=Pseudomonas quercus TaxID=2722792 RepID=A0ABX0YFI9_9PSED|nr:MULTISPECIES: DUF6543 domain-containing protein [Pseudomonas]MBF7142426.1 hypothetical protein [Pseudomonas sp. LY10J]NJP00964.1 hypothetical protein [Pseudomonas quercus]
MPALQTPDMNELLDLSHRWFIDYPDLSRAAETEAGRLLRLHQLPALDVHKVYWHRFDNAQSSHLSFSGWAHNGPPVESLTLPQLILRRFAASDQDSLDDLNVMSGFYSVGPQEDRYDHGHEVWLLPSRVSQDFWHANFADQYQRQLSHFWATRLHDFVILGRASALVAIGNARRLGLIGEGEQATLLNAFANGLGSEYTLSTLGQQRHPAPGIHLHRLGILDAKARDVLWVQTPNGQHFLYLPNDGRCLYAFDTAGALEQWMAYQASTVEGQSRLLSHFDPSDPRAKDAVLALGAGRLSPGWLRGDVLPAHLDPFAWLGEQAALEMHQHADVALTTNDRLRKDLAIAFLSTLARLGANLAPVGWPIALGTVISATVAMGLDIDKAVHARSAAERDAAIGAAVSEGLTALFTLPFLASGEVTDWPWEIQEEKAAEALPTPPSLPASPVSATPLNSIGMVEQLDWEGVFAVEEAQRGQAPTKILNCGLTPTRRFERLPAMVSRPARQVFGSAEGALAYAQANIDGPFHLFRIQAQGLRVASLRANLRLNRANTLASLGQLDRPIASEELQTLAEGAWLEHECHVAMDGLTPARLRLLSPISSQAPDLPTSRVLRGVQQQPMSAGVLTSCLIEVEDSLRVVRFDPFSDSWRTLGGTAFRYNAGTRKFDLFDPAAAAEPQARDIEAATAELGIPATYPWEIPPIPTEGKLPIPRVVHSVWLGGRLPRRLADNLIQSAIRAGRGRQPFEYRLYVHINDPVDHSLTLADLASAPSNFKVQSLDATDFWPAFQQSPYYEQFLAATEGSGINYASATDVLRYRLLNHYGGVYMDVDDMIYDSTLSNDGFSDQDWTIAPGRLMLNDLVSEPRLGLLCGFNNSNFASLAQNPLLDAISEESYTRFLANQDLYFQRPYQGSDSKEAVLAYARRINHVTGPGVFNDVMTARLPDVRQFRAIARITTELYIPPRYRFSLHREMRRSTPYYCPLAWRIKIGSTASWLHTR